METECKFGGRLAWQVNLETLTTREEKDMYKQ